MREMTVYGVSFDIVGKQPIVLLKTQDGEKFLPIWIGHPEAASILMKLQGSAPPRPLTHDLVTSILDHLETEVVRITVTELRENTFYARITLRQDGQEIEVDSRPSDAIAIAVRAEAKIFATEEVIEESGIVFEGDDEGNEQRIARVSALADLDPDEFRAFLDEVTAEDFAQEVEDDDESESSPSG
jgi:bifunctional DNase/RNase